MRLSKVLLTFAAASMMATPVVASAATANPAAKLSISNNVPSSVRASSKGGKSRQEEGSSTGLIVAGVAVLAVAAGVIAGVSGDSDSDSN